MKLTVLGSGTNRITLARSCPSYLLEIKGKNILIDTGNGCARQLIKIRKHLLDIDAILFTHFHKDHYLELPVILNEMKHQKNLPNFGQYPNKKVKKIKIFGPRGLHKIVGEYNKVLPIEMKQIRKSRFSLFGLIIKSLPLLHVGPIIGYRFNQNNKSIVFTSDSRHCSNSVLLSDQADILIHSVGLPKQFGVSKVHPTPDESGRVAQEANVKKLILTHFYPAVEKYDVKKLAAKYYKGPIKIAKDLMTINI